MNALQLSSPTPITSRWKPNPSLPLAFPLAAGAVGNCLVSTSFWFLFSFHFCRDHRATPPGTGLHCSSGYVSPHVLCQSAYQYNTMCVHLPVVCILFLSTSQGSSLTSVHPSPVHPLLIHALNTHPRVVCKCDVMLLKTRSSCP